MPPLDIPAVLVVDDDPQVRRLVAMTVQREAKGLVVVTAGSVAEAVERSSERQIRLFVLDVELPDGTGLDFLQAIRPSFPDASVVVITGMPLMVDEGFNDRFGVNQVLRKPFDLDVLRAAVRELLSEEPQHFEATLRRLTPTDVIQLKGIARATTSVRFTNMFGERGVIYFREGRILHAETGELSGIGAFNAIVTWQGGSIEEIPVSMLPTPTIPSGSWEMLLMEAVRLADEAAGAK